jgi:hypothetical protein
MKQIENTIVYRNMSHLKDLRIESAHFRELSSAHLEGLDNLGKSSKTANKTSNVKNERKNVLISFWKRNQNVLVSFPNLSWWEQIVSIFSPESALLDQIDMISFDGADSGMKTQTFWFHSC